MPLSALQKFILREAYLLSAKSKNNKVPRKIFSRFYNGKALNAKFKVKVITKSLERLIDKGLLSGYGEKTKEKWFIGEVKLTPQGKREAKKLMGVQTRLPFGKKI